MFGLFLANRRFADLWGNDEHTLNGLYRQCEAGLLGVEPGPKAGVRMWNPAGRSIEADIGDDGSIRLFVAVGVVSRPSPRRIYRFSSELVSWFFLEVRSP